MHLVPTKKFRNKKGKTILLKNGKTTRVYKNIPEGCSSVRQLCIKCFEKVIRKNDSNYESKICKECTARSLPR